MNALQNQKGKELSDRWDFISQEADRIKEKFDRTVPLVREAMIRDTPILLSPAEIVAQCKASLKDTPYAKASASYDLIQLKYDGWWIAAHFHDRVVDYITSGGEIRLTKETMFSKETSFILIGEWMYGTNRSQKDPGILYVHDILIPTSQPYSTRLEMLKLMFLAYNLEIMDMFLVKTYEMSRLPILLEQVVENNLEGLVFKNSQDTGFGSTANIGRWKPICTMDYVVMDFCEGGGRLAGSLGAIRGGLYIDGALTSVISVGGGYTDALRHEIWENRDNLVGKVFEAVGWQVFPSGSMRHPQFSRFRDDKRPEDCILK